MEKLTLPLVQIELFGLLRHYPEAGINGETLNALAGGYLEDLQAEGCFSAAEFTRAVKLARRRCQFFPKVVDLLTCWREVLAQPSDATQITWEPKKEKTDAECQFNRECAEIVNRCLEKEITPAEMEWQLKQAQERLHAN